MSRLSTPQLFVDPIADKGRVATPFRANGRRDLRVTKGLGPLPEPKTSRGQMRRGARRDRNSKSASHRKSR